LYDILLNVEHKKHEKFFQDMKKYMPRKHKEFLEYIRKLELHDLLKDNDRYDICLNNLKKFRSLHMGIVYSYVIKESKKIQYNHSKKGAAGTPNLMNFLGDLRKDTENKKVKNNLDYVISLKSIFEFLYLILK